MRNHSFHFLLFKKRYTISLTKVTVQVDDSFYRSKSNDDD